jgi:hypothetical protein
MKNNSSLKDTDLSGLVEVDNAVSLKKSIP